MGLATSHLIFKNFGLKGIGVISIVLSVNTFMMLAELGVGAVIVNGVAAKLSVSDSQFADSYFQSTKILRNSSWLTVVMILAMLPFDLLRKLLNLHNSGVSNISLTLAFMILALGLPARAGFYLLMGVGKNNFVIMLQTLPSLFMLLLASLAYVTGLTLNLVITLSTIGVTLTNFLCLFFARKLVPRKEDRIFGLTKIRKTAMPFFFATTFSLIPIRITPILLIWFSTLNQVAIFAAVMSFYQPAVSIIQSAAPTLWAEFAKKRAKFENPSKMLRGTMVSGVVIGMLGSFAIYFLAPFLISKTISPDLVGHHALYLNFAIMVFMTGLLYPLAMFLTSDKGLKFQAINAGIVAFVFVGLCSALGRFLGAVGASYAFVIATVSIQLLPTFLYVRSELKK
jgi:O-antigen/teichoic acid export membrane protein